MELLFGVEQLCALERFHKLHEGCTAQHRGLASIILDLLVLKLLCAFPLGASF
jgi:hypothetical protein